MSESSTSDDISARTALSGDGGPSKATTRRPRPRVCKKPFCVDGASRTRKYNLRVPAFSSEDPEIWFCLLEGQFDTFNITEDNVKFNSVISNLDIVHAKAVKDVIVSPPAKNRYEKIKSELIRRLSASHEKKVKQLLTHEHLGDRKPSAFLRHLQDLAGPAVPVDFIRTIWSNRLPSSIQTVLASQPTHTLDQLADLADRIQEITSPCNVAATSASFSDNYSSSKEIAELKKMVDCLSMKIDNQARAANESNRRSRPPRRRSYSRNRNRTRSVSSYRKFPVCWYHNKYGSKAATCVKPCDYDKSGNLMGSR